MKYCVSTLAAAAVMLGGFASAEEPVQMKLGEGHIIFTVAPEFKKEVPANRIIEFEFSATGEDAEKSDGRMTAMGAGGSLEANVARWMAQFQQPDGSKTEDKAKVTKEQIAGQTVHTVDISGTYADGRPFGPKVQKEDYRMLAAIIMTEKYGNYFIKFYGPEDTIKKNEAAFKKTISSLEVK
ncbi:hypothetical protein [Lignipirellula cremea]|uniref:PsbP C-terminal domain-containing protein n=1 Tax=Lignipirellula cremea TaxID=2528010 RepID=A0A518DRE0_9BACT|nr:hypothetical protein [Lignipirellula cremea]QDU94407.1 hypothetical protein Pla8534_21970 [Lignipirellula cremea]